MATFSFAAQPTTSLFGNSTAQKAPSFTGFSGSTQTQAQAPGTTPNSGFTFCGGQAQQQPGQNNGSGGLFGSNANTNTAGGGTMFGQPQQQQQQQQQAGGATGTGSGLGGSLFGSGNATGGNGGTNNTLGGSLFGQPLQQQQQTTMGGGGGGLFGQQQQPPQQQQQQQQQAGTGGLFGGSTTNKPTTGLFGSLGQSTQQQPAQGQGQQPGGMFSFGGGASSSQPQQLQQPSSSLFASTSNNFGGNNLLGNSQLGQSSYNANNSGNPGYGRMSVMNGGGGAKQEVDIETRMGNVQHSWDSNHPDCRFKYFFYNVVDEGTTHQYGRPAGATDDAKWAKAVRENPDPARMVPVLATGWADIKKRTQMQENIASVHQQKIKEISDALAQLTRQSSLSSSLRLTALQTHLNQLLHRLIHIAGLTPQLIPSMQTASFRQEEADTRQQLEGVKADLEGKAKSSSGGRIGAGAIGTPRSGSGGGGRGRMIGQVNELWGQVEEIRRSKKGRNAEGREGWLGDEKALADVAEILSTQQMALQKLTDLLDNALFDADVMKQGLGTIVSER